MEHPIITALPKKEISYTDWYKEKYGSHIATVERILFLDPTEIYKRVEGLINPYKRHAGIQMDQLFPKLEGICACGCGEIPKSGEGWQRKWATDFCQIFASDVLSIINNYFGVPAKYITLYYGKKCSNCPCTDFLELDHIVGVKQGGGGSWLSNYRWLCKECHNDKTNRDFNRRGYQPASQTKLL